MSADDYGRSLKPGLQLNLLVADIARSIKFQETVLGARTVYADEDFALMAVGDFEWMLHADHTYEDHEMSGVIDNLGARGCGIEIRIHGCDPDLAEQSAREGDYIVLAGAMDKPHGLREAFIVDDDGYVWVPDMPLER